MLVAPLGLTALAWAFSAEAAGTVLLGAGVLRRTLGIGPATLGRAAVVVGCGALAVAAGLGAIAAVDLGPVAGVLLGGAVTVVVLGLGLWGTNAPLLRELAGDVHRLRGRSAPGVGLDGLDGQVADEPGGNPGPERVRGDVGAHQ